MALPTQILGITNPKRATISSSTSGDNTVVAAVTGKKIRVTALHLVTEGAVVLTWKSGATSISGALPYVGNSGLAMGNGASPIGLDTTSGEALVLNLSQAVGVRGWLAYIED